MRAKKGGTTDDRRGIQSIEVGFSLLQILAQGPTSIPLKDIAAAADMTPSKAHLYLVSFSRLGLTVQDPVTARYSLGPAAIRLGIQAINQLDLVEAARYELADFANVHGISVSLAVWSDKGPTIIYRVDGKLPVHASVRVGHVLPLLPTATGRIFMAHLPKSGWQEIAQAEAKLSPGLSSQVEAMLEGIRQTGIAITDSQLHIGFFGISAPILDSQDQVNAAVSAHGLSDAIDFSPDGPIALAIRHAARAISERLGARLDPVKDAVALR